MLNNYRQLDNGEQVSPRTFYRLCGILTHGETKMRTAVDYVSGLLVNDTMLTLKSIVSDLVPDKKQDLFRSLDVLRSWLKYGSFADAPTLLETREFSSVDMSPRHQLQFGLSALSADSSRSQQQVCCGPCLGMHKLLNYIIEEVKSNVEADARTISVVHDCFEKIELFMGHRVRVTNQQRALANVLDDIGSRAIQGECLDEALVVIDFKMKAEPIYFREKTLEHYGKRGMSWHGAMVQFWSLEPDAEDSSRSYCEEKVYYNHISGADNRQDKEAVVALVEAVLIDIKRDLPQINRIVIQSDNASSYQNAFLAVMLPVLGMANGIEISRFIHSETQDGKLLLDAQFARAARKVKMWVLEGHDCTTPTQLVAAFISNGGLPNTMAEIVEYDRKSLELLAKEIGSLEKAFARHTGRLNDILYEYRAFPRQQSNATNLPAFDLRSCPKVLARTFQYSGIGTGKLLELDFSAGVCRVAQSDNSSSFVPTEFDGDEVVEMYQNALQQTDEDDGETIDDDDSEDEDGLSSEVLLPRRVTGPVTGVQITTEAQIRRRVKKWKCSHDTIADLPTSRMRPRKTDKDVTAYAIKSLLKLKNASSLVVTEASDLPRKMIDLIDCFSSEETIPPSMLEQGWARRPQKGKMYGAKYIQLYMDQITVMFQRGAKNKSDKMGPARMVEVLRSKNPKRYDIPGENEVRTAISRLFTTQRTRPHPRRDDADDSPPKIRPRMELKYTDFLKNVIVANPQIAPRHVLPLFRKQFPDANHDVISDLQLKRKVTHLKKLAASAATQ